MNELETSLHLFQPPIYKATYGNWTKSYSDSLNSIQSNVTVDPVSITSILSFGWVAGDKTLVFYAPPAFHYTGKEGAGIVDILDLKEDYDIPGPIKLLTEPWNWGRY